MYIHYICPSIYFIHKANTSRDNLIKVDHLDNNVQQHLIMNIYSANG